MMMMMMMMMMMQLLLVCAYLSRPKAEVAQLRQFDEVVCTGAGHCSKGQTEVLETSKRAATQQL